MYGKLGRRGSWEVDHSRPQAKGGTHHGNNLLPACIKCNRKKRDSTSKSHRAMCGLKAKPSSTAQRNRNKLSNTIGAVGAGMIIGARFGAPGLFVGTAIGVLISICTDPE